MTDKEIIIDDVDVSGCKHYNPEQYFECNIGCCHCEENPNCYYKQLKRKEQECEELHNRTASIIYNLTGGRLSYSTYTLESCADAYRDQLSIDVERATKELEEENETLKRELNTFKQALDEIRQYRVCEINDVDGEEDDVILGIIDEVMEP